MTGEKDPRDVMQAEHDARLSEHPAFQAPAEMPGEEAIHALLLNTQRDFQSERDAKLAGQGLWPDRSPAPLDVLAKALAAYLAPILAERDEFYRDGLKAEDKWNDMEARALAAEAALAAERERVEQLHATIRKAHVAMTMACALPGVAAEYDFSEAIASTEATLARRAAAIRAQGE